MSVTIMKWTNYFVFTVFNEKKYRVVKFIFNLIDIWKKIFFFYFISMTVKNALFTFFKSNDRWMLVIDKDIILKNKNLT